MILDGVGIVFMVMTLGAADSGTHPDFRNITHPVSSIDGIVFLGLDAALVRSLQQAVVAGGDFLPSSGVRQEVSGELLLGELVKGGVVVEGLDDVVPVGRDVVVLISMVADGVGEAHQVEPVDGHALTEVRGGDQ